MDSVQASNPTSQLDIPLDFTSVDELPDSHTWIHPPSPLPSSVHDSSAIPVIDLAAPHAITLLREACEQWGVFQVTNHGIPVDLLHQIEDQTRCFFALPSAQKLLVARSPDELTGFGRARISDFFAKQMWYEGFTIIGSPTKQASLLWPNQHTIFCEVMEEYQKRMEELSERIMDLMLQSMGLGQEDIDCLRPNNKPTEHHQGALQLNSYPMCPDPDRAMGLAPHTDSSLLTILHQGGGVSGLQVFKEDGGWVAVQPVESALVVNVGDLMQIISNGRLKSALHQAVVNKTCHRMSVAYFYGPARDVKILPVTKLVDLDHPLLYRGVTWKEYLDAKKMYFDKALESIKI